METGSKRITDRSINCFLPLAGSFSRIVVHGAVEWDVGSGEWQPGSLIASYPGGLGRKTSAHIFTKLSVSKRSSGILLVPGAVVARKLCGNIATCS